MCDWCDELNAAGQERPAHNPHRLSQLRPRSERGAKVIRIFEMCKQKSKKVQKTAAHRSDQNETRPKFAKDL